MAFDHIDITALCIYAYDSEIFKCKIVFFYNFREGQAIWMDENIRYGKTDRCQTFNNPPLCPSGDFEIRVLEVYGFVGA